MVGELHQSERPPSTDDVNPLAELQRNAVRNEAVARPRRRHQGNVQDLCLVWEVVPSQGRYMTRYAILAANKVSVWSLMGELSVRNPKRKANATDSKDYGYRKEAKRSKYHPLQYGDHHPNARGCAATGRAHHSVVRLLAAAFMQANASHKRRRGSDVPANESERS